MDINKIMVGAGALAAFSAGFLAQDTKIQTFIFGAGTFLSIAALLKNKHKSLNLTGMVVAAAAIFLSIQGEQPKRPSEPIKPQMIPTNQIPPLDFCQVHPEVCQGNLGVSRIHMPQLEGEVKENFLNAYSYTCESIPAKNLIPIQKEGNYGKVLGMVEAAKKGKFNPCQDGILITEDGRVIDGHHRLFACNLLDRNIGVIRFHNLTKENAIQITNEFPGVTHQALAAFS